MQPDELRAILEDLGAGLIDVDEAARRGSILESEPDRYRCNSCRLWVVGMCHRPSQPVTPMHPLSVRCGEYQYDDPRDHALPVARPVNGSRLFK